ncbi:hypothetical protein Taro_018441, partial [Colocasia esculenta]|nr:hypothetical protein [Colocasia esculenta]
LQTWHRAVVVVARFGVHCRLLLRVLVSLWTPSLSISRGGGSSGDLGAKASYSSQPGEEAGGLSFGAEPEQALALLLVFCCLFGGSEEEDFVEQCINKTDFLTLAMRKQSGGVGGYLALGMKGAKFGGLGKSKRQNMSSSQKTNHQVSRTPSSQGSTNAYNVPPNSKIRKSRGKFKVGQRFGHVSGRGCGPRPHSKSAATIAIIVGLQSQLKEKEERMIQMEEIISKQREDLDKIQETLDRQREEMTTRLQSEMSSQLNEMVNKKFMDMMSQFHRDLRSGH